MLEQLIEVTRNNYNWWIPWVFFTLFVLIFFLRLPIPCFAKGALRKSWLFWWVHSCAGSTLILHDGTKKLRLTCVCEGTSFLQASLCWGDWAKQLMKEIIPHSRWDISPFCICMRWSCLWSWAFKAHFRCSHGTAFTPPAAHDRGRGMWTLLYGRTSFIVFSLFFGILTSKLST